MAWIYLIVIAQLINATVLLIDKFIVTSKAVRHPFQYAFLVSVLSVFSIFAFAADYIPLPFIDPAHIPSLSRVLAPSYDVVIYSLGAGVTLFYGLYFLFSALARKDASDVSPVVGGMSAVVTLLLSIATFSAIPSPSFLWGVLLLVIGTILISHLRFDRHTAYFALMAAALFGANSVIMKILFTVTAFDNGFLWSRLALAFIAGLAYVLFLFAKREPKPAEEAPYGHVAVEPSTMHPPESVHAPVKHVPLKTGAMIIGNKILAGIASILILKAIELGDQSVVQALGGLQFVFILILGAIFAGKLPHGYGEKYSKGEFIHKGLSVLIIGIGFWVLFL